MTSGCTPAARHRGRCRVSGEMPCYASDTGTGRSLSSISLDMRSSSDFEQRDLAVALVELTLHPHEGGLTLRRLHVDPRQAPELDRAHDLLRGRLREFRQLLHGEYLEVLEFLDLAPVICGQCSSLVPIAPGSLSPDCFQAA